MEMNVNWKNVSSLELCLEFFARQTELKILELTFHCEDNDEVDDDATRMKNVTSKCPSQKVFFQILSHCRKLKIFKFFVYCNESLYFDQDDMQKFVQATSTSNLKELAVPLIAFDCKGSTQHLASLNNLECLELQDSVLLEVPKRSPIIFCEDLSEILKSKVSYKYK